MVVFLFLVILRSSYTEDLLNIFVCVVMTFSSKPIDLENKSMMKKVDIFLLLNAKSEIGILYGTITH